MKKLFILTFLLAIASVMHAAYEFRVAGQKLAVGDVLTPQNSTIVRQGSVTLSTEKN